MVVVTFVCILTGCTTTKNVSPPPISIPKSMPAQDVEYALISCLGSPADEPQTSAGMHLANDLLHYRFGGEFIKKRYWRYEGREQGAVFAGFYNRKFYMRVKMAYDSTSVNFSIIDSRN